MQYLNRPTQDAYGKLGFAAMFACMRHLFIALLSFGLLLGMSNAYADLVKDGELKYEYWDIGSNKLHSIVPLTYGGALSNKDSYGLPIQNNNPTRANYNTAPSGSQAIRPLSASFDKSERMEVIVADGWIMFPARMHGESVRLRISPKIDEIHVTSGAWVVSNTCSPADWVDPESNSHGPLLDMGRTTNFSGQTGGKKPPLGYEDWPKAENSKGTGYARGTPWSFVARVTPSPEGNYYRQYIVDQWINWDITGLEYNEGDGWKSMPRGWFASGNKNRLEPVSYQGCTGGVSPIEAVDDSYTVDNTLLVQGLNVLENDEFEDEAVVEIVSQPEHGNVKITQNNQGAYIVEYSVDDTIEGAYAGADSFSYQFTSGDQTSNIATVNLAVEQGDSLACSAAKVSLNAIGNGNDGGTSIVDGITLTYNEGVMGTGVMDTQVTGMLDTRSGLTRIQPSAAKTIDGNINNNNVLKLQNYLWQSVSFDQAVTLQSALFMSDIDGTDGNGDNREIAGIFALVEDDNGNLSVATPDATGGSNVNILNVDVLNSPNLANGLSLTQLSMGMAKGAASISPVDEAGRVTADLSEQNVRAVYFVWAIGADDVSEANVQMADSSPLCFAAAEEEPVAPVANDDSQTIRNDQSDVAVNVLDNDELSAPVADLIVLEQPDSGSVKVDTVNGQMQLIYTPQEDYVGNVSLTYQVTDTNGLSGSAAVNLNVEDPRGFCDFNIISGFLCLLPPICRIFPGIPFCPNTDPEPEPEAPTVDIVGVDKVPGNTEGDNPTVILTGTVTDGSTVSAQPTDGSGNPTDSDEVSCSVEDVDGENSVFTCEVPVNEETDTGIEVTGTKDDLTGTDNAPIPEDEVINLTTESVTRDEPGVANVVITGEVTSGSEVTAIPTDENGDGTATPALDCTVDDAAGSYTCEGMVSDDDQLVDVQAEKGSLESDIITVDISCSAVVGCDQGNGPSLPAPFVRINSVSTDVNNQITVIGTTALATSVNVDQASAELVDLECTVSSTPLSANNPDAVSYICKGTVNPSVNSFGLVSSRVVEGTTVSSSAAIVDNFRR